MDKDFLSTILKANTVRTVFASITRSRLVAIQFTDDEHGYLSLCYCTNAGRNVAKGPILDIRSHDVDEWRQARFVLVYERLIKTLWRVPTELILPTSGMQLNDKTTFIIYEPNVVDESEIQNELAVGQTKREEITDLLGYLNNKKETE
jgi:hypothetical protein